MYVTRPLSLYRNRNSPNDVDVPPEGPNSGYLVIQDEEYEAQARCCFGLCRDRYLKDLPFPQNRRLTVEYTTGTGENSYTSQHEVFFVPVINQPLSSNRYYVIHARGKHGGKISTSSKEEDMTTCCFCKCVKDVKPRAFDLNDEYQQVEIVRRWKGHFHAKSVVPDGFPQDFLRTKGWSVYTSVPRDCQLGEATGLNEPLRGLLPDLNSPAATIVGKWYCPFMFVTEEGQSLKDQMKRSLFYEMSLEQFWEEIYACENYYGDQGNRVVEVNASVKREVVSLQGNEAVVGEDMPVVDGMMWFKPVNSSVGGGGLGLSMAIVERMRWEQGRGGWVGGKEEKVERREEFGGEGGWRKFGCYVLVERFALKRMDGSLALTYDFRHTNKIRTKWDHWKAFP